MSRELPLNQDAFRYLAARAGLATAGAHVDELYPYVQIVLSGVRSLDEIDVAGAEPDLVFIPSPELN